MAAGPTYGEDLSVGAVYQLGAHTVSEAEMIEFAAQWAPQDFHTDKDAADAGQFGGLIASGIHTISIYQRLAVLAVFDLWSVIAGRNLSDVRFLRPVRPGDMLTGTVVIEDIVFDDHARALVTTSAELVDGRGNRVLSLTANTYVHARCNQ